MKEEASEAAGITIDSRIYHVTVTVTDDGRGQLKAAISGDTSTGNDLNFENTFRSGSLTVRKTVTGDLGEKNKYFTFTVTFDADGTYSYTGSKTGTIRSGESVLLKHGESITITGIPENTKYTVVESDNADYCIFKDGDVGTISADQPANANFTNTRNISPQTGDGSSLTMWKYVTVTSFIVGVGTFVFGKRKRRRFEQ